MGVLKQVLRSAYAALPLKRQIFGVARVLGHPPHSLYRHLHFRGPITIPVGSLGSFKMQHFGYQVENDLFWAGYGHAWEGTSLRVWAQLARSSSVILDIGANSGVYALAAAAVNPSARVIAFEPVPRIAQRLNQNIALNGLAIDVVVAGVSAETGRATLYDPVSEHPYSASLSRDMLGSSFGVREISIETTRIDTFVAASGLGRIDLVKIDAEKHEVEVLLGFGEVIERDRPVFLIELLDEKNGDLVAASFAPHGYKFYAIEEGHSVVPVERLGQRQGNYLVSPIHCAASIGINGTTQHAALELK